MCLSICMALSPQLECVAHPNDVTFPLQPEAESNLKEDGGSNGLTWVKPGTLQIFSQTPS